MPASPSLASFIDKLYELLPEFRLHLFTAGCAVFVLKKLHDSAAFINTGHHQGLAALLAVILDECQSTTMGTGDMEWSSASRAELPVFLDTVQALWTGVAKGAVTAADRAEMRR